MLLSLPIVLCFTPFVLAYTPIPPPYIYETKWYHEMPIDHFDYNDNRTFSMRYLVNDTFFKPGGPIFFYTGNEGSIDTFAENTGFMWDIAPMFNALLLFGEHRFYGETMPFGKQSYETPDNLGYLSSEQALADYAVFLTWFKRENYTAAQNSKVIAFGGSYGGLLAAWIRMKYPHIVAGSLSSAGPVAQFDVDCGTWDTILTQTFQYSGEFCAQCIKNSWSAMFRLASTASGRETLNNIFHLCPNSTVDKFADVYQLQNLITLIYTWYAEFDYPYPTNFLVPLPGWPATVACSYLTTPNATDEDLLTQVSNAISVYLNYTGNANCYTFDSANTNVGTSGWQFQMCTQMVWPMCSNASSMFPPSNYSFSLWSDLCFQQFGVRPRQYWGAIEYGVNKIQAASNIIFSNGNLDPCWGGGITQPIPGAPTLYPIFIERAAHHYDLRGGNPQDTPEIMQARQAEIDIIKSWL